MADISDIPIIDAHIHLYPKSEVDTLAWFKPGHPLGGQHSISEYVAATEAPPNLRGFVFVEADRKNHLDSPDGWKYPLMEVDWIVRIATGAPKEGEGHQPWHKRLCLAMVPWAPVPLGRMAMREYVADVKTRTEGKVNVPGFRYLVNAHPKGTMTAEGFIDSLKWLGEEGYLFELGIDQRQGGLWQMDEAIDMIRRAHDGVPEEKKVAIVISKIAVCAALASSKGLTLDRPYVQTQHADP